MARTSWWVHTKCRLMFTPQPMTMALPLIEEANDHEPSSIPLNIPPIDRG